MARQLNRYSSNITQAKSQGASQAMLYALGLQIRRPGQTAGRHRERLVRGQSLQHASSQLAEDVKEGRRAAGLVGMRFNTIGVSDGISMGTDGMSFSLQSRDLIADSIETVMAAQWYDANISHPRMRQEHAGLCHGHGTAESAVADGLRRNDSCGLSATDRSWTSFPLFRATANTFPATSTKTSGGAIVRHSCPGPAPAAACTRRTRWLRRSRRWACPCRTAHRHRPRIR